jgi:hypothetical protein
MSSEEPVTARWELKLTSLHSALLMHDAPAPSRATQRTVGYGNLFLFSSDLHCILKKKEKKILHHLDSVLRAPYQTAICGLEGHLRRRAPASDGAPILASRRPPRP